MQKHAIDFSGTPFLASSKTRSHPNRLNWRSEKLLAQNRHIVEGKRVLDLASHDGRFSYACLELGAKHVTGVEFRPVLVDNARENLRSRGYAEEQFRFLAGDMFAHLPSFEPGSFDTILCFGFLYHTIRQIELFDHIRRIGPRYVLIDTVVHRDRALLKLLRVGFRFRPRHLIPSNFRRLLASVEGRYLYFKEEDHRLEGNTSASHDVAALPTRALLETLLALYGFTPQAIAWDNSEVTDWSQLEDYHSGRRVSYLGQAKPTTRSA